ncbi:nuclear transport factor 2 family protein [Hydrogenophaga sp. UC242_50]|jgi:hypothetical protein|uniref:nuclear transport factor 2 family protein n=1 Tax=unclassified Hydrogenophaga TaxID=2610897 RepID=UPI0036D22878
MTHQTGSPSMESLVNELFQRYEREFNRSLRGDSDLVAVANLYAKAFIAATPSGVVTGQNDDQLKRVMADGFERYRQIGMSGMKLQRLDISGIDDLHALARVDWTATYAIGNEKKTIDFTNAYLVRREGDTATVFGWITGDEEAVMKAHGIVP